MLSAASDGLDAPLFSAYRCRDSHTAPAFDDSRLFDAEMARDMRCVGEMAINTGLARLFLAATQLELCLVRIRLLGAANPLVEDRVLNIDRAGEIAGGRGSKHCRGDRLGEGRMSGQARPPTTRGLRRKLSEMRMHARRQLPRQIN